MNYEDVYTKVKPLLKSFDHKSENFFSKLFQHPSSFSIYDSLDNELYVRDSKEEELFKTILVSSCVENEGRTTTALTLAVFFAACELGKKILLVDADFENGGLSQIFNLPESSAGLEQYFKGKAGLKEIVHQTKLENLHFTPVSSQSERFSRLDQERFEAFIEGMSEDYDMVIVDSSPGNRNRSVMSMAKIIRYTLFIIKYNGPTRHQISNFLKDLERVNAHIIGTVLSQRRLEIPWLFYGTGS